MLLPSSEIVLKSLFKGLVWANPRPQRHDPFASIFVDVSRGSCQLVQLGGCFFDFVFLQIGFPSVVAFDPDELPFSMLEDMTGQVEYDCPVYQLYLVEDSETRDFVIFNESEEEIYSLEAADDYNPADYALTRYPDLYSGSYTSAEISDILATYDPSRIQISVKLVPESFYSSYLSASKEAASAAALLSGFGGGIMMMGSSSSSQLVIMAVGPAAGSFTNGIEISVHAPTGFTNNVEIYSFDEEWAPYEGTNSVWFPLATNLVPDASSNVVWTNSNPGNVGHRFYAAGSDVDDDGDGLSSAMEIFMFNSDPTKIDTDGDGFVDGGSNQILTNDYPEGTDLDTNGYVDGEATLRTNPTNIDISPPTVTITWPTNDYEAVFIP